MARKKVTTTIGSVEELEQVFGEYAASVLELATLSVELERRLQQARTEFEDEMALAKEDCDGLFADIQSFGVLHPELFKDKKSLDLVHGTIGFRTGTPAIKLLAGVKTEHAVQLASKLLPTCIRIKAELDKDALLARFASGELPAAKLAEVGLQVERKEVFYADVKNEKGGK